ncbi:hypothetical protein JMJ55_13370 [Belnapia sp. T6]|uniref:Uncharacterized protein n=1 Tax=Belnapia mucosa TaxID=2804532 RepID=A0ABS1V3P7_9PROT|nr:hypothetical protein [Belnapia mucosa]MBL6456318.1 hypothetical protein [Belnapia mucosa]
MLEDACSEIEDRDVQQRTSTHVASGGPVNGLLTSEVPAYLCIAAQTIGAS